MLWMETYLFCFSVRLGVIIAATLSFFFILMVLLAALKFKMVDPLIALYKEDDNYNSSFLVVYVFGWMEDYPQQFLTIANVYFTVHMATCISSVYGAYRLKKWFVVPFIFIDFFCCVLCCALHISLMIVLKKVITLGPLIALTLLGGFVNLFLCYSWVTCIAFIQIINLIYSEKYQILYGTDPLRPIPVAHTTSIVGSGIHHVHVFSTPNSNDVDNQKRHNQLLGNQGLPPVIVVKPLLSTNHAMNVMSPSDDPPPYHLIKPRHNKALYNDPNVNYNYWQWSELAINNRQRGRLILQ